MVDTIVLAHLRGRIDVEYSEFDLGVLTPTRNSMESVRGDLILGRMLATEDRHTMMPVMDVTGQRVIDRAQAN